VRPLFVGGVETLIWTKEGETRDGPVRHSKRDGVDENRELNNARIWSGGVGGTALGSGMPQSIRT
jgi:hypothetical protein